MRYDDDKHSIKIMDYINKLNWVFEQGESDGWKPSAFHDPLEN